MKTLGIYILLGIAFFNYASAENNKDLKINTVYASLVLTWNIETTEKYYDNILSTYDFESEQYISIGVSNVL